MHNPDLFNDLKRVLGADQVRFDTMSRLLYSTDASNYQIMPLGVTFPRHVEDVIAVHEVAAKHQVPILPRGAGTSLAGQTVNTAVVMDFSRHLRRVRAINADEKTIMVEPGLVIDHLNQQVQSLGLMYGPDPASSSRATVGGSIGNNSTGSHSIIYGMASDHVRRVEVVLANGERTWLDADNATTQPLRDKVAALVTQHQAEIQQRFPKTWRTVAGYALNKIDPLHPDLKWLVVGSEGTLCTVVQAELRLVPRPKAKRLALLHFDSLRESLETTPRILETQPSAVELIDRFLLDKTRNNPHFAPLLTFVAGDPAALLIVEYYASTEAELATKIDDLQILLTQQGYHGAIIHAVSAAEQARVWEVRKAGLNLLTSERTDLKSVEFIEDVAVPVDRLAAYVADVEAVVRSEGTTFAIYAHASAGCLHIRPLLNLRTVEGLGQYRRIAEAIADLVLKYEGTITGEHGEGIVRGEFSEHLFGKNLVGAFREVKQAFDPYNQMNPGKKFNAGRMDDASVMRHSPHEAVIELKTRFDWSADMGFMGALEMCNGSGVCRKEGTGTMCPSYMATLDEAHLTRGRANALRHMMMGHVPLADESVRETLDLCLSCKACQSECPSSVDVARMKAEFMALYYDQHGTPLSARIFGNVHQLNKLGSTFPRLSNLILNSPLGKLGLRAVGIPDERPLPTLAVQRFTRTHPPQQLVESVATLVVDTFTEFNHPEIGAAFLQVVKALGLQVNIVRLPDQGCCGRPAISKGLLDQARTMAEANVTWLASQAAAPYLFLEPSCLSAFTDDYLTLVKPALQAKAKELAIHCQTAESWIVQQLAEHALPWQANQAEHQILVHGHCHQKALWGTSDLVHLLKAIPGVTVSEIDSGCCGMAGSFGYEHPDISKKIASQRLLPAIEENPTATIAAPGTSCRAQLHEAGHHALHPVEIIAQALQTKSCH